ncbi:MAG: transporter [Epsilonproteobacteria bacterium]|nr:transporter [Campylobacterota bacterium]
MVSLLISILGIYLFVGLGAFAKWRFKEELHERSLILVSVYILQPFLTFWGLTTRPFDPQVFAAAGWYLAAVGLLFVPMLALAPRLFADKKRRAIFLVGSLVGNTANLGIPLGIALFGEASVPYTTMINIANVFFVNLIGVYLYSSGSFDAKTSVMNVLKMPILWSAVAAIGVNIAGIAIPARVEETLRLGAYASIVIQLLLFGIYLSQVKAEHIYRPLAAAVGTVKFLLLPAVAWGVLAFAPLDTPVKLIILMETMTPLAIANVNFAALFTCRPKEVAALVLLSSLFFLLYFALLWPLIA